MEWSFVQVPNHTLGLVKTSMFKLFGMCKILVNILYIKVKPQAHKTYSLKTTGTN